jgi:hypothetical protein
LIKIAYFQKICEEFSSGEVLFVEPNPTLRAVRMKWGSTPIEFVESVASLIVVEPVMVITAVQIK